MGNILGVFPHFFYQHYIPWQQHLDYVTGVECAKILSIESLRPSDLERQQNAHHLQSAMKLKEYLRGREMICRQSSKSWFIYCSVNVSNKSCGYMVASDRVACSKKAITIAEELTYPCSQCYRFVPGSYLKSSCSKTWIRITVQ